MEMGEDKAGIPTSASATDPSHPSSHPAYSPSHLLPRSPKPHARGERPKGNGCGHRFLNSSPRLRLSARWAWPVGGGEGVEEEKEGRKKGWGGSGRTNHGDKVKSGQVTQSLRDLCYRKKWRVRRGNNQGEKRIL